MGLDESKTFFFLIYRFFLRNRGFDSISAQLWHLCIDRHTNAYIMQSYYYCLNDVIWPVRKAPRTLYYI